MFTKTLVAALVAAGALGVSASSNDPCTSNNFTVNSQADFSSLSSCQTITGNLIFGPVADTKLDLSGPTQINGDVSLTNNMAVMSLSSSSLRSISGTFSLINDTSLMSISMPMLSSVNVVVFQSLGNLNALQLGTTGLSTANSITISDTFIDQLSGLDLATIGTLDIDNNRRLTSFTSKIQSISTKLTISANSQLTASFPNLVWCVEMDISNTTGFSAPALQTVNNSIRFDSNTFKTFQAPNLTSTTAGDVAFVSNNNLVNISFPELTIIGGGLTIANNSALSTIDGFPVLKTVAGAVLIKGVLNSVVFPALNDVKGAFTLQSTNDITTSCAAFNKMAPTSEGGNNQIQGNETCSSNVQSAGNDTGSGTSGSGSGSGNKNAGASLNVNLSVILGLLIFGATQALL